VNWRNAASCSVHAPLKRARWPGLHFVIWITLWTESNSRTSRNLLERPQGMNELHESIMKPFSSDMYISATLQNCPLHLSLVEGIYFLYVRIIHSRVCFSYRCIQCTYIDERAVFGQSSDYVTSIVQNGIPCIKTCSKSCHIRSLWYSSSIINR